MDGETTANSLHFLNNKVLDDLRHSHFILIHMTSLHFFKELTSDDARYEFA